MKAFRIVVLSVVAATAVAVPTVQAGDAQGLFGPKYLSDSVEKDGKPFDLVGDTRLEVKFAHERHGDVVRWSSGCNKFGARIEITGNVIDTNAIVSTKMACRGKLMRQDRFFAKFFAKDPAFEGFGRGLSLFTNRVLIELRRPPNQAFDPHDGA